jgi:UDP-GlcNAc:undecaprenyl-phosphate/decaprenyl-phosphate GlcNAc-1-phosphate transferase
MHHLLNAILTLLGLTALNSVRHTTIPLFKRYFFVPARKSKTMALQIGGLPIAFSMFITLLVYYFRGDIENQEIQTLLVVFLVSSVFISGIGYLDDKIELRPVYKLLGQMFVCFAFSFISSLVLENYYYSILTFLGLFIFSMAVMNGSNLIDGVDTLCLKIAAINFSTYYTLATIYQLEITKQISLIGLVPMICFWFFNREPAKIHLGEIGSSLLGYYYILISMVMFHEHLYGTLGGKLPIIVSCALPLLLPTTELGFTFLRRIINGKSPFVGDRLHVHHLLLNHFKFSPTKTANTISLIYLIDMAGTCYFIALSKPLWAVGFSLIFKFTLYAYIAVKFWLKPVHIEVISPRFIFNSLRKKDVTVINFKLVDKIDFQVITEEDSDKKDKAS